jgi:uncharacterized membrane protein
VHPPHTYPRSPVRAVTPTSLPLSFHSRHANTAAPTIADLVIVTIAIAIALTSTQWECRDIIAAIVAVSIVITIAMIMIMLTRAAQQVSPRPSAQSDFSRQPYLYMVAIPPGYLPSPVDPSRLM